MTILLLFGLEQIMPQKNVLIVCATTTDRRELEPYKNDYQLHFQEHDGSLLEKILCGCTGHSTVPYQPMQEIQHLIDFCKKNAIDAVISTEDYPGCIFASIVAHHLGLPGPSPQSVLTCQHKYHSRLLQQQVVPDATPDFRLIDPTRFNKSTFDMPLPVFIKPVKSYFSIFANKLNNKTELEHIIHTSLPSDLFLQQLNWCLMHYSSLEFNANYLIAETLLEGIQVTLEGFVFEGNVEIIGIVDSIMFPGTLCFERFDYPSHLPEEIQQRMHEIAKKFVSAAGLNNLLFNVEFMYNALTDEIHIIEVNSRMSSQFADMFEKVNGVNTYQILLDIALSKKPLIHHPQKKHNVASSFVLRRFENGRITKIPTDASLAKIYQKSPDARVEIHLEKDQNLDAIIQDGKSFRYGLINLGAKNWNELFAKFKSHQQHLAFEFGPK